MYPTLDKKKVQWKTDNYACTRIVKSGSNKHELQVLALKIFDTCRINDIKLDVVWIPRDQNKTADYLSKCIDKDDWEITTTLFDKLNTLYGPFTIDRFASNRNTKTLRFNSKYLCPNTEAVDAFTQNWESENNLLVPPVGDICRVIKYFENKHVSGTLLVPYWKSAPF